MQNLKWHLSLEAAQQGIIFSDHIENKAKRKLNFVGFKTLNFICVSKSPSLPRRIMGILACLGEFPFRLTSFFPFPLTMPV